MLLPGIIAPFSFVIERIIGVVLNANSGSARLSITIKQ